MVIKSQLIMRNNTNPFAGYGSQVTGDSFIGRKSEISKIKQRVLSKEFGNLSIVGLPKIGKSSLMYQAIMFDKEIIWNENKILPIWISVKSYTTPREFYQKLVFSVFSELKKKRNEESLIQLLDESLSELKRDELSFVETENSLLCFFSDIVSSGIRIIVCLDEFDYAKDLFDEVHYQLLRTLSYEPDHRICFVTTSRRSIYDIERYSGQGSNFFGTFDNVRLGVFFDNEDNGLFEKAEIFDTNKIKQIKYFTGNHPYLISMVLYKSLLIENVGRRIEEILDESQLDIVRYFDDIFYVLEKDKLTDKLIRIYSGIDIGVSQSEEEYLLKYGLFIQNAQKDYIPFCDFFDDYLNLKWKEVPFKLIWPEAERSMKKLISDCLDEIYGDEWESLLQTDLPSMKVAEDNDLIKTLKRRRTKEIQLFGKRASNNLIDQLYPRHYPIFVELHWKEYYEDILENSLDYWLDNLNFIADKIRNPESHSRYGLVSDKEYQKASLICREIVEKVGLV